MESINVLVLSSIGDECLRMIETVSPKIKLQDSSYLWDSPDMITPERPGDFSSEEFDAMLAQAEVIYGWKAPRNVIARAPMLKWFQAMSAGADDILDANPELLQSPVLFTTAKGIHGTPVGELSIMLIMMLARKAQFSFQMQQKKRWQRFVPMLLRGKTVGIVGMGNIGKEVARLAKAFGMRVIATRRSAKRVTRARYVDKVVPREQLPELLSESDFVVLVLPRTPGTNMFIGERELKAMKPTAYLINVGRGSTVDEDALIRALEEHWIAGAGIDAHATEPLPPESRFWGLSNVIISPHVGGVQENYNVAATELFCENLERYLGGKRLRNVVNKKFGY